MKKSKAIIKASIVLVLLVIMMAGCQTETSQQNPQEVKIEEETWDLLWVSDSSGWGVADVYGQYIAEDNNVEVNVIDNWIGGLSAGQILQGLRDQNTKNFELDKLRETIAESEVIVIYGNPSDSDDPSNPGDWNCGQNDLVSCYVNDCSIDTFSQYIADLKEIYSIIFEIRQGKPTIIRAIDSYNPNLVNKCQPDGVFEVCTQCWETYTQAIHQAADEMGVPVGRVFDAWNGEDHIENPVDKGYTQEDNIHPSELGAALSAQVLRDMGYAPIIP